MNRRDVLKGGAASAVAGVWSGRAWAALADETPAPEQAAAPEPRRLLVLGGTNFLGPAVVERARARGHEVTLFNRGITRPELFPELERLRGERLPEGGDLSALAGARRWDAVIDVWPEHSRLVERAVDLLGERSDYWFFCSSVSVYKDFSQSGVSEDADTWVDDPGWYGGEKAVAEALLAERLGERAGVARFCPILGPRDDGVSLHYWLRRLATQAQVLAPGPGDDPVQFVDVRDAAAWIVDCVEQRRGGVHNLCGPPSPRTLRSFLEGVAAAIDSRATLVWADPAFLRERGVRLMSDLPLWLPEHEDPGFFRIDVSRSAAAGARFRPLADTARDSWRWYRAYYFKDTLFPLNGTGLSSEREQELLTEWARRG